MFRVLSQTLLAFVLLGAGGYLSFVFLQSLADGPKVWAILSSLPMGASGIFLLMRAGKSDATVIKKTTIPTLGENTAGKNVGLEGRLEESNQMTAEWNKTNKARERLRMLEVQATGGKDV